MSVMLTPSSDPHRVPRARALARTSRLLAALVARHVHAVHDARRARRSSAQGSREFGICASSSCVKCGGGAGASWCRPPASPRSTMMVSSIAATFMPKVRFTLAPVLMMTSRFKVAKPGRPTARLVGARVEVQEAELTVASGGGGARGDDVAGQRSGRAGQHRSRLIGNASVDVAGGCLGIKAGHEGQTSWPAPSRICSSSADLSF